MLFDNWYGLVRATVVGIGAYAGLVFVLRVSGKRTLTKMNAFDLVVTVALGSTLATVLLNESVSLAEGLVAFTLLTGLQYAVTWSSVRWAWVSRAVKSEPRLLYYRGILLHDAMRQERLTGEEIQASIRLAGFDSLDDVEAVVLETSGDLSVMRRRDRGGAASDALSALIKDPSET